MFTHQFNEAEGSNIKATTNSKHAVTKVTGETLKVSWFSKGIPLMKDHFTDWSL